MDGDDDVLILWWYLRRMRRKRCRKRRQHWVHPILRDRFSTGTFETLMGELRNDEAKFFNYFRMSFSSFDDLLGRISMDIKLQDTRFRECICPQQRLSICLRYFASGCSFKELHYSYRVGISTISKIIKETSVIIWKRLCTDFMKLPDTEGEWEAIANGFETKANFPHCLGAVDGKHIRIIKPCHSGSMFFNYKDYFSFVLLAVVDSEYRFIYISIGSYGKECDSTILKNSTFWQKFNDGSLNIPNPKPVHETIHEEMPYVLIGDEGFSLTPNLLRPYGGTHLDHEKKIFNYRLSRARRYVECVFGILANKWRILHRPIDLQIETAINVIKACTVLHNFVRDKDGINLQQNPISMETSEETGPFPRRPHPRPCRGGPTANIIRRAFAEYFSSDLGSIPWQETAI
ncbi:protein ALP1-like [Harmonia axyridis]|uniref:protein ALP1-like n=1 Tax=Harmonia axyridis TaxID=115357 RepID=UPI001E278DD5|nr:protein ALP1-like [Harmonia axyridis]